MEKKVEIEKQKPTGTLFSVNTLSQKSTNIKNLVAREAAFQFFSLLEKFSATAMGKPPAQYHKTPATGERKKRKSGNAGKTRVSESGATFRSSVSESGVRWVPFGMPSAMPHPGCQPPAPCVLPHDAHVAHVPQLLTVLRSLRLPDVWTFRWMSWRGLMSSCQCWQVLIG